MPVTGNDAWPICAEIPVDPLCVLPLHSDAPFSNLSVFVPYVLHSCFRNPWIVGLITFSRVLFCFSLSVQIVWDVYLKRYKKLVCWTVTVWFDFIIFGAQKTIIIFKRTVSYVLEEKPFSKVMVLYILCIICFNPFSRYPHLQNPAPICMFYFAHPFGITSPPSKKSGIGKARQQVSAFKSSKKTGVRMDSLESTINFTTLLFWSS